MPRPTQMRSCKQQSCEEGGLMQPTWEAPCKGWIDGPFAQLPGLTPKMASLRSYSCQPQHCSLFSKSQAKVYWTLRELKSFPSSLHPEQWPWIRGKTLGLVFLIRVLLCSSGQSWNSLYIARFQRDLCASASQVLELTHNHCTSPHLRGSFLQLFSLGGNQIRKH